MHEVNLRLKSASQNIADMNIMDDLYALRTRVFTPRSDRFHWRLRAAVETNGRFRCSSTHDGSQPNRDEDDVEVSDLGLNYGYSPGDMVVVRPQLDAADGYNVESAIFWIAEVQSCTETRMVTFWT